MTCLHTDDTASVGNETFFVLEKKEVKRYKCKERETSQKGRPLIFNGATISRCEKGYTLTQSNHINRLAVIGEEDWSVDSYVRHREGWGYISSTCRPDPLYDFSYAAQFTAPDSKTYEFSNKGDNQS